MTAQQLRNSILQQAIQGRLVPQDPNDEPASVLLEKISVWKNSIPKSKKKKSRPDVDSWEAPFEIPSSWVWVKWGEVSSSIQYGYNAPAKESGRIKMVRISDIQDNKIIWDTVPYCDIDDEDIIGYKLQINDILFARTGGTVGKSYLVTELSEDAVFAGYLIRTHYNSDLIEPYYLKYFMDSSLYWSQLKDGTIATAQPNCNGQKLSAMYFPLPPLAEQRRIIAKIEELMPLVEKYGKAQSELDNLNASLPSRLRQSILQEAIQGKLIPQDPNEEPAKVLLEKIRVEKSKKGKPSKKELAIAQIAEEDYPYLIPSSWRWERFGNIVYNRDAERIPLSVAERSGLAKIYDYYGASSVIDKVDRYLFDEPLLLIGEDGANLIARSTPIAFIASGKYWVNNHAHVLDCMNLMDIKYLMYYINAISLADYVTGTAQPKMNQEKMNSIPVAVPPLAQQRRIVAKIEELFAEIDKLK